MSGTCLVTALADREAELLEKARLHWPAIEQRFDHIAVHVTDHTNAQWCRFLDDRDVPTKSAKQGWNSIASTSGASIGYRGVELPTRFVC